MSELVAQFNLLNSAIAHLTSAVQFGFICGTLVFAILTIADRYAPSKVFFASASLGALFNLGVVWDGHGLTSILILRFMTGFFLAGIYPVGMKIAADYFDKGLGRSLGYLVGALVLGTAFPHLIKDLTTSLPWKTVLIATSGLAVIGGILMISLVPNGPYRKSSQGLDTSIFLAVFKNHNFRSAAFGYFGHMWELYAFWAFTPVILSAYAQSHPQMEFNIPLLSFFIIGIGSLGCVMGGYISEKMGVQKTARVALLLSFLCCFVSPFAFEINNPTIFLTFMLFWGIVVIADSPLFSTLVAQNASPDIKGTALTIVNCIGFSITIVSIQLINSLRDATDSNLIYLSLAIGPLLGLLALKDAAKSSVE